MTATDHHQIPTQRQPLPRPAVYDATLRHCLLISAKIEDLTQRLADSQAQLYAMVDREYRAGRIDLDDLGDLYTQARAFGTGFTGHWNRNMPVTAGLVQHHLRTGSTAKPNAPGGAHWTGQYPYAENTPTPPKGKSVVYVLFDDSLNPIYVGSTRVFRDRMRQHRKAGKRFTSWLAYPCQDRAAAYRLEAELLDQYRPRMNGTGRGAAV